jgi:UDP:flavonoid glycosyltransferase YjiC (YdhE family)
MALFGSLGDLHPYLAVAIGLQERGHEVTIATSKMYRREIEREGVGFHAVRPDLASLYNEPLALEQALNVETGDRYVMCRVLLPCLEQSYADLLQVCRGKDLLLNHHLTLALRLVAETLQVPWISIALQPYFFLSTYDPPAYPTFTRPFHIRRRSSWEFKLLLQFARRQTRSWMKPVDDLRRRLGLAPSAQHPVYEGRFSPYGCLAWFSRLLASPRPDWPILTRVTGFPFYPLRAAGTGLDDCLSKFLERGEPPVIFTLGSVAYPEARDFFDHGILAARHLGCRAILLTGSQLKGEMREMRPDSMIAINYVPYSALFPYAAAIVHHGGIGTTAQALRAGHPMLVVPFVNDQFDNAQRTAELGVARVVHHRAFTAKRAAAELTQLLSKSTYSSRAAEIGKEIRKEDGIAGACDALEELMT